MTSRPLHKDNLLIKHNKIPLKNTSIDLRHDLFKTKYSNEKIILFSTRIHRSCRFFWL